MSSCKHIVFLLAVLYCTRLLSQPQNGTLAGRYTTLNGLSGNEVVKTLKDDKGFLWIATHNGISRFDGKSFKNFTHNPSDTTSLRSIWVTDLVLDNNHTLWATTEWGLCYFDEMQNRFRYIHPKDVISVLYKAPVMVDTKGTIWLAAENGLFKINALTKTCEPTSLTRIADPSCISEDKAGNIIIGTRGDGIYWYYPSTGKYKKPGYTAISPLAHVLSFLNYNNRTWAATEEGILEIYSDDKAELFNTVASSAGTGKVKPLVSMTEYPAGDTVYFLCSTYDKKFLLFNPVKKIFTGQWTFSNAPSESPALVHHILTERGTAWLSTQTGLYKIETGSRHSQFQPLPEKSRNGSPYVVQSILPDNKNPDICWILAEQDNGTLMKYDMQRQVLLKKTAGKTPFKSAGINYGDLLQDETGRILTFTDHYINIYTAAGDHIKEIKSDRYINCACFDKNGNIWIGTADGIALLNKRTLTIQYFDCTFTGTDVERRSLNQSFATNDILDNDINSLWLCSGKYGLFSFNKQTAVFTPYRQPFSGSYSTLNRCTSLLLQKDTVWVGTMAGLTAFISSSKKFINLNISNGLKSTYVYSICRDSAGLIWGRGNQGLFYLDPASGLFNNYTLPDSYNDAYFLQNIFARGNQCLLGLPGGFTTFSPRSKETLPVFALLNSITAENKQVFPSAVINNVPQLELGHTQNDIRIDFTAINFSEEPVFYRYQLDGQDKEWADGGEKSQVGFSNLSPGRYTFNVQCRLGEGDWGTVKELASIYIKAAWWQTTLFKIAAALLLAALITSLYIFRIRQLKKRQQEKNKMQQLQLEQYRQELETEQITNYFSVSLVDKKNLTEVLTDVAKNLIGKMGFEDCMIYLWNADKTKLIQHAGHGVKGAIENTADKEKYHIPAGKGIVGATVALKQPHLINDTGTDNRYISADGIVRLSELCVPIMDNDEVLGAINIEHTGKNFFTRHHQQLVSTIAALVASKIKAIESISALHQKQLELADTNRQLAESEVAMLRSQMNPHFIFNSLNSVQKYIWENREEDAAEYLASFAKLMRGILENSRHEYISLQKETEFLKMYIDLEYRRSNNNFNYVIKIDETLDTARTLIPPMLLQPFIENAIWHGLNKKTEKGNLLVHIFKKEDELVCIVDDDGAGRDPASINKPGKKSFGISITQQRIERLIEKTSKKASVTITDKMENNQPAGTRVLVILPLQTTDHA